MTQYNIYRKVTIYVEENMEKIKYYLDKYKLIIILIFLTILLGISVLYTILRPNKKEKINEVMK